MQNKETRGCFLISCGKDIKHGIFRLNFGNIPQDKEPQPGFVKIFSHGETSNMAWCSTINYQWPFPLFRWMGPKASLKGL
jgi:hypothetical protein